MAVAAGVPWATPHVLKHSVIFRLARSGHSARETSELTGAADRLAHIVAFVAPGRKILPRRRTG